MKTKINKEVSKAYHKYSVAKYNYLIKKFTDYIEFHNKELKKLEKK